MTNPKKPKPAFTLRMTGSNIRPWLVPMRALARTLGALQKLLEFEDNQDSENILHLMGIKTGSAVYQIAADNPSVVLNVLRHTGTIISDPNASDWSPDLLSPLEELSAIAKSMNCTIELGLPDKDGDVLAKIEPDTYASVSVGAFIEAESSIYGRIERVGGATEMHCALRIPDHDRLIICRVASKDIVRELGLHLYQETTVHGLITWHKKSWKVKKVLIRSIDKPKHPNLSKALEKALSAGGMSWAASMNVDTEIKTIRGD